MSNQPLDQPSEDARTQVLIDQILHTLATKAKDKDEDSRMICATAPSPSPVSDGFEASNTPNDNDKESQPTEASLEKARTEDTVEYPPPTQAALVMLALLLALFLSALVSQHAHQRQTIVELTTSGPHNHRHSPTSPHRRIRLPQRDRLVRKRLPPHLLLLHPLPRPHLHLLLTQIRLPVVDRSLRDRFGGMWLRAKLDGVHHRTSDLRLRRRRADERWHGPDDQCDSVGEEAGVDGCCWCYYGCCKRCWAVAWWSIYDECELEVVLLQ